MIICSYTRIKHINLTFDLYLRKDFKIRILLNHRYHCFVLLKFWRLTIFFDFSGNKRCSMPFSRILHGSSLVPILPIFSYQDFIKIIIIKIQSTCNIPFLSKEYVQYNLLTLIILTVNVSRAVPGKFIIHFKKYS